MTTTPRLTIAVLARNRPGLLRQMLHSALVAAKQGGVDFTVVVRDHSDDDQCERVVVDEFAIGEFASRFTHRYTHPRGQLENVLGAVEECETEFLAIVNDDDLCEPNFVSELLPPLIADPATSFSTGSVRCIDLQNRLVRQMPMHRFVGATTIDMSETERAREYVVERRMRPFMGTVFRTAVLHDMELPQAAKQIPDLWVARHLVDSAPRGWYTEAYVFRYRVHRETASGAARDLEAFRWSFDQFIADDLFAPFRDRLAATVKEFERHTLLGEFVRGGKTPGLVDRILSSDAHTGRIRHAVHAVALHPPFSAITKAYLRQRNPRLRR